MIVDFLAVIFSLILPKNNFEPIPINATVVKPAVAEAGVIGKPDPIAMEIVKAFVTLNPDYEQTDQLRRELIRFSREKLSAGVAPREIDFLDTMPKT